MNKEELLQRKKQIDSDIFELESDCKSHLKKIIKKKYNGTDEMFYLKDVYEGIDEYKLDALINYIISFDDSEENPNQLKLF